MEKPPHQDSPWILSFKKGETTARCFLWEQTDLNVNYFPKSLVGGLIPRAMSYSRRTTNKSRCSNTGTRLKLGK
jgi:hypothetical protein